MQKQQKKFLKHTGGGSDVDHIIVAEKIYKAANRVWGIIDSEVPFISQELQVALRQFAIGDVENYLLRKALKGSNAHKIVQTSMTMYLKNGVPDAIFTQEDMQRLHDIEKFSHVVTLIEDPNKMAERFEGTPYSRDVGDILNWTAMEVGVTEASMPYSREGEWVCRPRRLILPRENSDTSLAKLLNDSDAQVIYLAGPITHMKDKQDDTEEKRKQKYIDRKRMDDFQKKLQEYAVVITPMVLADQGVKPEEIAHTVHRDISWFVGRADIIIAFFPGDYFSAGTTQEIHAADRIGKPVIVIHPKDDREVFGIRPRIKYRHEDELFSDIEKSGNENNGEYSILRKLLNKELKSSRYKGILDICK